MLIFADPPQKKNLVGVTMALDSYQPRIIANIGLFNNKTKNLFAFSLILLTRTCCTPPGASFSTF